MGNRFQRGLVTGKFYPPHRGHKFLIDYATAQCESMDVLLCERKDQTIPGPLRAAWLREIHPQVNVIQAEDLCDDGNSQRWAEYTLKLLGRAPDAVFSSEDYGDAYARYLGCEHVKVDRDRQNVPVTGAMVREDPLAYWDYLEPCVAAHFLKRICLVGAESTGTTSFARRLAEHYRTVWVPEYGRDYTEARVVAGAGLAWKSEEFTHIALRQQAHEDELARQANRVMFCDTDALATCVWHERYLGNWSLEVEEIANRRGYDLYFVTEPDIPFVHDRIRDSEHLREWMTERFKQEISKRGYRWVSLAGDVEQRMRTAIDAVETVMKEPRLKPLVHG